MSFIPYIQSPNPFEFPVKFCSFLLVSSLFPLATINAWFLAIVRCVFQAFCHTTPLYTSDPQDTLYLCWTTSFSSLQTVSSPLMNLFEPCLDHVHSASEPSHMLFPSPGIYAHLTFMIFINTTPSSHWPLSEQLLTLFCTEHSSTWLWPWSFYLVFLIWYCIPTCRSELREWGMSYLFYPSSPLKFCSHQFVQFFIISIML